MITGAWSVAWVLLAAGPVAQQVVPGDVMFSKKRMLDFPINVDPARQKDIRNLELYVSTNQGASWSLAATAAPNQSIFRFTAPTDGLYWFTVLTYDLRGTSEPPSPKEARQFQKVFFDSKPPDVHLVSAERKDDSVVVRWEVSDDNLDLSKLRVEYQPLNGSQTWAEVTTTKERTGQAAFQTPAAVTVRVSASDMAENVGTAEAKVLPAAGTVTASKPPEVPLSGEVPVAPPPAGTSTNTGAAVAPVPSPLPTGQTTGPVAAHGTPADTSPTLPVAKASDGPPTPPTVEASSGVQPVSVSQTPPRSLPAGGVEELTPAPSPRKETSPGGVVASSPTSSGASALPSMTTEKDLGLQIINNRRVTMEYEVTKLGPSGVGSVDLYVTRDGGLKWNRVEGEHGVAPTPPGARPGEVTRRTISVDVGADGVYGFYLVVKSGAGLSKESPKDGSAPQMRVEVDTTPPAVELYAPQPSASQNDVLVFSWKATDNRLAANPITLQWAERKEGEWRCIGDPQMPNVPSFSWRVPTNMPPKVYLRLTVRDAAGNAAVAETKTPVQIDLSVPEPHLIGLVRGGSQ
jgi:hypothetical protein